MMEETNDLIEQRIKKLDELKALGVEPFGGSFDIKDYAEDLINKHGSTAKEELEASPVQCVIAGRIIMMRDFGKAAFAHVQDSTARIQVYFRKDILNEKYSVVKKLDIGDIIGISGKLFRTKTHELTIEVDDFKFLTKSLRPLPEKWHGLKDIETRYRQRYVDLIVNPEVKETFKKRSTIIKAVRDFLETKGFIEVETPVLETTTGGAEARPFVTHHNALDMDVYLRISVGELWQKRLMVAGLPKTFEIGRVFRNEGMSAEHAQDYTAMEFYEAFKDYEAGMEMITDLYRTIADEVYGTRMFSIKGFDIDLDKEWEKYDYCALMQKEYGLDPLDETADWARVLSERHIPFEEHADRGRLVDTAWKQVRKTLSGPGFLINVPVYMEPLAKKSAKDPRVVERFQVVLAGSENGKGFSELNDPIDQSERFAQQGQLRAAGDEEAQMPDAEFVEALEYGMPPAFGFGVSERLFSFLEGVSIREGQIFPLLRPR